MKYFRHKDTRHMLKQIAKRDGRTLNEVLEDLRLNIEDMRNSEDPEQQAIYKKLFGNKTPTPEEFIEKMSKYTMKGIRF